MAVSQAVILVGGRGTRLGERTDKVPKPMLPVGDRPFLDYLLWFLSESGVTDVVMCVGYLAEIMEAAYGQQAAFWVARAFSASSRSPAGTGGALFCPAAPGRNVLCAKWRYYT